ncbi:hypothetical protein FOBRF1_011976 [Fusarium oxysporum]
MKYQYDPFLGHATQWPPAMEQPSVLRSCEMNFSGGKDFEDWYMVPSDPNLAIGYEYPRVPSFADDIAGSPYFIPQSPKQYDVGFGRSPVENDEFLLVDHSFIDVGRLLDSQMNLDNGYMLHDSYQSINMPLASPSSVGSAPESSPWGLVEPVPVESVWDLSALHPDSCNISGRRHSESFNWSGPSTPKTHSHDDLEGSSPLLAISLMETFRYPCPHKSCTKTFKRKEHAKRHFLTKHKPHRLCLQCEFCGKDTFTRTDNLNAHRRLHARHPPRHNSGVHFVPAALEALQKIKKPTSYSGRPLRLNT